MPPLYNQFSQQSSNTNASSSSSFGVLANIAERQEKQYRKHIEQNETMGTGIAMRLARGGQFEGLLGREVTEECREKLRSLAEDNVSKDRQLKAYVNAIRVVADDAASKMQTQTQTQTQHEAAEDEDETDNKTNNNNSNAFEFKEQMETEYAKALETISKSCVLVTQEPSYLQLCKHLGDDEDEDDELAVVAGNGGGSGSGDHYGGASGIKCPLTMAVMEDPVRSRVCKHSFQRSAILQHLRVSGNCPVPGCVNARMTAKELEDDPETLMRVRRYKTRVTAAKKARAQTALDLDDDDDDDNNNDDGEYQL